MGLGSHHLGTQNRLLRSSQHYPLGRVGERDTSLPLSGTREEKKSLLALLALHTGRTQFNATTTPGLAPPQLLCVSCGGQRWGVLAHASQDASISSRLSSGPPLPPPSPQPCHNQSANKHRCLIFWPVFNRAPLPTTPVPIYGRAPVVPISPLQSTF